MAEIYTCICGGQRWTILGAEIECDKCGKEYRIKYVESGPGTERIEDPEEFNERIRKEA